MKTKIIFLMLILSSVVVLGQNVKSLEGSTITRPKFTGAQSLVEQKYPTVETYLKERINYPEEATYDQGTVVIGFVVTSLGGISDFKVINSVSSVLDNEVINAIKKTNGMWTTGFINDEAVAMEREISIVFRLNDFPGNDFTYLARKHYTKASELLFVKQNPGKALRYFDKGIVLLPNNTSLLALRGLTRYELGDKEGAEKDWTRINTLGGLEGEEYIRMYSSMKGYEQMSQVLQK